MVFCNWRETRAGVPQGSVLGPLLFSIFINDLFFMVTDIGICNFADDTTIFAADSCLDKVLERIETDAVVISKWFPENFMKLNEGKCHLLTFGTIQSNIKIKIGEAIVEETSEEKLLGVILDKNSTSKVIFQAYVRKLDRNCMPLLEYPHSWMLESYVS